MLAQEQFDREGGQKKLIDYPLAPSSIVFDVGGFRGQWTADLIARGLTPCRVCGGRQDPYVFIFEPVAEFAEYCRIRFLDYPKVRVLNYGLCGQSYQGKIKVEEAASSLTTGDGEAVQIKDIEYAVANLNVPVIDLMSINIEGGEYSLLRRMIDTGVVLNTKHIQIQFHQGEEAEDTRNVLHNRLSLTHELNWNYPFVWESWRRKGERK